MSGTADIYTQTSLQPGKLELLAPWLQQQDWFEGDAADLERVGNFRFVDPDGEVGLDSMLLASGGRVYHVPVTWRGAELAEGELIGTRHDGTPVRAPADGHVVFPNPRAEPGQEWFYFARPGRRAQIPGM